MSIGDLPRQRVDQIYRTGPETLVAEAPGIVAGTVTEYSRRVLSMSEPESDGFPLKWVAGGQLGRPQVLKGPAAPAPLHFSRSEQSLFVPGDNSALHWERAYGELRPNEPAVMFLGGGAQMTVLRVVPSGVGEQDLIGLVKDIVQIQAHRQPEERAQRWSQYLHTSPTDEGRKAALRSLVNAPVAWAKLDPQMERLLTNSQYSSNIRAYVFGIVAFGVVEGKWGDGWERAVALLCRVFSAEREADQAVRYMQHLKLLLAYSNDEAARGARQTLRRQLLDCLRRRAAAGHLEPELEDEFRQVMAADHEE